MANHASHAALPYPIRGARFAVLVPYLDADGDPTDPTTPDTEVSKDNGAFADCAEEVTTASGSNGVGMITLSGAETDCSLIAVAAKVASGPKATLMVGAPRVLASVGTGTLSAGSAGGGTLGTLLAYDVTGCFVKTTGGTGGGGTGGANNQARKIVTYNTSTGAFTVEPNWETTPDATTTYAVLLPEGVTLGMLRALNPTTPGRRANVASDGVVESNVVQANGVAAQSASGRFIADSVAGNLGGDVVGGVQGDVVGSVGFTVSLGSTATDQIQTIVDGAEADVIAAINALNQSASRRVMLKVLPQFERPESGSSSYEIVVETFDADGADVNADSTPTLTVTGLTSGSLAANLSVVSNYATGKYRWTYTLQSNATLEMIRANASATIATETFSVPQMTQVCDFVAATWTTADRTMLTNVEAKTAQMTFGVANGLNVNATHAAGQPVLLNAGNAPIVAVGYWNNDTAQSTDGRPQVHAYSIQAGAIDATAAPNLDAAVSSRSSHSAADAAAAVWGAGTRTLSSFGTLVADVTAAVKAMVLPFFRLFLRKDSAVATDHATQLGEINANTGTGTGTYSSTNDSQESIRDNLAGGGGTARNMTVSVKNTRITTDGG